MLNESLLSLSYCLITENADDYCPSIPKSRLQELPESCIGLNGNNTYEVGQCEKRPCRGESMGDQTCGISQTYCCAGKCLSR